MFMTLQKLPTGQAVHTFVAATELNLPTAHRAHVVTSAWEK
jgi:hypothetical protein